MLLHDTYLGGWRKRKNQVRWWWLIPSDMVRQHLPGPQLRFVSKNNCKQKGSGWETYESYSDWVSPEFGALAQLWFKGFSNDIAAGKKRSRNCNSQDLPYKLRPLLSSVLVYLMQRLAHQGHHRIRFDACLLEYNSSRMIDTWELHGIFFQVSHILLPSVIVFSYNHVTDTCYWYVETELLSPNLVWELRRIQTIRHTKFWSLCSGSCRERPHKACLFQTVSQASQGNLKCLNIVHY